MESVEALSKAEFCRSNRFLTQNEHVLATYDRFLLNLKLNVLNFKQEEPGLMRELWVVENKAAHCFNFIDATTHHDRKLPKVPWKLFLDLCLFKRHKSSQSLVSNTNLSGNTTSKMLQ